MAEQSNRTNPAPQEQEQEQKQEQDKAKEQEQAKEPWWMDHVRQLVVGPAAAGQAGQAGTGQTPPPPPPPPRPRSGPPEWALPSLSPPPPPPPAPPRPRPQQQPQQPQQPQLQQPQQQPQPQEPQAQEQPPQEPQPQEPQPQEPQPQEQPPREPELKGFTKKLPIASILDFLSINRQSGTLYLTNSQETFTLEILEGDIVHASSNLSNDEQLLGSILVARDKIGTEQLEDFYRRFSPNADTEDSSHYDDLVSREDLKLALEAQVQELFNRLYAADDCSFCFYEGETSGVEQRIRMNVTRLLLESARNQDELEQDELEQDDAAGAEAIAAAGEAVAEVAAEAAAEVAEEVSALEEEGSPAEVDLLDEAKQFDDGLSFAQESEDGEHDGYDEDGEYQEYDEYHEYQEEFDESDEVDPADLRNR